jgi:hypothetical protein
MAETLRNARAADFSADLTIEVLLIPTLSADGPLVVDICPMFPLGAKPQETADA